MFVLQRKKLIAEHTEDTDPTDRNIMDKKILAGGSEWT